MVILLPAGRRVEITRSESCPDVVLLATDGKRPVSLRVTDMDMVIAELRRLREEILAPCSHLGGPT